MKKIIGLTGQTGSGKSSLKSIAENEGYYVIDCDEVAHEVIKSGSAALQALTQVFSDEILSADGTLSRKALAAKAFSSKENTELLNKTVLPFIAEKIEEMICKSKCDKILLDAPTLIESGIHEKCENIIVVLADEQIRKQRIMERDNISEEDAMLRIRAGKKEEFYKQYSGYTIYNNGEFGDLSEKFRNILKTI